MNTKVILGLVAVLAVVGAAVIFLGQNKQASLQTDSVTLTSSGFTPQSITVKAGTKVAWTNNSGTTATIDSAVHPTHLAYPPLNLGSFASGETLSLAFDQPGTYKYHNHLDASQTGVVVVN